MRRSLHLPAVLPLLLLLASGACGPTPVPVAEAVLADVRMVAADGRLSEAQERLAELDAEHPADARVAVLAGEVATWRGDHVAGLLWMRRAAERAPDDPEPHLRAAYVLLVHPPDGEPDVEGALAEAAAALADAGGLESAEYRACRGEAALVAGDDAAAATWFRGSLELRADCRRAVQRLLQLVAGQGAEAEAERAALNARLSALISGARRGSGMENARMPVGFCGHGGAVSGTTRDR